MNMVLELLGLIPFGLSVGEAENAIASVLAKCWGCVRVFWSCLGVCTDKIRRSDPCPLLEDSLFSRFGVFLYLASIEVKWRYAKEQAGAES